MIKKLLITLFVLVTMSARAQPSDPVGCEAIINNSWSSIINLVPTFDDSQPPQNLSINFKLTGLYGKEDNGGATTYSLSGQYAYKIADNTVTGQLGSASYGTCIQRDSDNVITWVQFYFNSASGSLNSRNLDNSSAPTDLNIPNGGVGWWVNGVQYYNQQQATLQKD